MGAHAHIRKKYFSMLPSDVMRPSPTVRTPIPGVENSQPISLATDKNKVENGRLSPFSQKNTPAGHLKV
jgi:hypothetical protein